MTGSRPRSVPRIGSNVSPPNTSGPSVRGKAFPGHLLSPPKRAFNWADPPRPRSEDESPPVIREHSSRSSGFLVSKLPESSLLHRSELPRPRGSPFSERRIVKRIQEKKPVEETIWEPVSLPLARFIAFEQMAKSVRRRRRSGTALVRRLLRTSRGKLQERSAESV
jgi:hypothetical protein